MTYRSRPVLLLLSVLLPLSAVPALAQKRDEAARKHSWDCTKKQLEFVRSLGALRQFPDALTAYLLSHKPGDKLDYGMCYNMREQIKRDIEIEQWRQTNAPECRDVFREREARLARDAKERGIQRRSIKERIVRYNQSCSHTMAGTL
jgi:hypothetical protein